MAKHIGRRDFLKATALLLGTSLFVSCAPQAAPTTAPAEPQGDGGSAPVAEEPTVAPVEEAPASKKEIIKWGLKYDPHIARYENMAKAYQEKTGVKVVVQPQDDPFGKPLIALAAGNAPDVACVMGKGLPPYLVKNAVLDLTDAVYNAIGTDIEKDWYGDGIPCYTYDGKIYGVPTEVSGISVAGCWPTRDLPEEEAKLYPPLNGKKKFDSYEQMWELAKKLQVEQDGKVIRYGISSAGWEFSNFSSILAQLGREWWDPANQTFDFANEDSVKAFQLLVETPVKMGIEAEQGDSQTNLAQQGKVAIARGNVAVMFFLEEIDAWFEPFIPPDPDPSKPPKYMGEGGWGFITLSKVANPEGAIDYLKWAASFDGQKAWLEANTGNYIWPGPLRKSMELPVFEKNGNPYHDIIIDMIFTVIEMQPYQTFFGCLCGYIGQIESACATLCSEIRQGNKTSEQAAEELQEMATNQFEQWKTEVAKES